MNTTKIEHVAPVRTGSAMDGIRLSEDGLKQLASSPERLAKMGIGLPKIKKSILEDLGYSMDMMPAPVLPYSTGTPVQYLQQFLQGVVYVLTVARKADQLAPIMTVGKWSDQQIVQRSLERFGVPNVYKDHGDIPISSWNLIFDARDIVRFELGYEAQILETERGQALDINTANEKREAITSALELIRNDIFFLGFAHTGVKCYGFLNDPSLPALATVANGVGGHGTWKSKKVSEIINDILTALQTLAIQSGGNIDTESTPLTLAIPLGSNKFLTKVDADNSFGFTVTKWLSENYPNIRVVTVPNLIKAHGGKDAFYLYADAVPDSGSDGGETMVQLVPARIQPLNTVLTMKGYSEGYTNAIAGSLIKRPYAVTRFSGI